MSERRGRYPKLKWQRGRGPELKWQRGRGPRLQWQRGPRRSCNSKRHWQLRRRVRTTIHYEWQSGNTTAAAAAAAAAAARNNSITAISRTIAVSAALPIATEVEVRTPADALRRCNTATSTATRIDPSINCVTGTSTRIEELEIHLERFRALCVYRDAFLVHEHVAGVGAKTARVSV